MDFKLLVRYKSTTLCSIKIIEWVSLFYDIADTLLSVECCNSYITGDNSHILHDPTYLFILKLICST